MSGEFLSDANTQMIAKLLTSHFNENIFENQGFLTYFNAQRRMIYNDRFNFQGITEQNKALLRICIDNYNKHHRPITLKKQNTFDTFQENYNKLLNPDKPKEIDFSDKIEDTPISDIDKIVNQSLADREKELLNIQSQYSNKNTDEWLNNKPKKLEIIDDNKKKDKRVRFEVKEKNEGDELSNLLSKLKKKDDITNDILMNKLNNIEVKLMKRLDEIEEKVKKAMNL